MEVEVQVQRELEGQEGRRDGKAPKLHPAHTHAPSRESIREHTSHHSRHTRHHTTKAYPNSPVYRNRKVQDHPPYGNKCLKRNATLVYTRGASLYF